MGEELQKHDSSRATCGELTRAKKRFCCFSYASTNLSYFNLDNHCHNPLSFEKCCSKNPKIDKALKQKDIVFN